MSYCTFEEKLSSPVVSRFDVAHSHDPSPLPVRFVITMLHWHPSWLVTLTFSRIGNKHVPVWCGFACLGWEKLTLTPSSNIPMKFLVVLKRTWVQKLSLGLMLLTFVTTPFFFAVTEHHWHPSWLLTLTFLRADNKHVPLVPNCRALSDLQRARATVPHGSYRNDPCADVGSVLTKHLRAETA